LSEDGVSGNFVDSSFKSRATQGEEAFEKLLKDNEIQYEKQLEL
jgi:hypothetical protein